MSESCGITRSACVTEAAASGGYGATWLRIDSRDGIATVSLDRPPLNILDMAMMHEILDALAQLGRDSSLRALVLRSELKVFSAGASVEEHIGDKVGPMIHLFDRLMRAVEGFDAPTVALVGGAALGGGLELALACDLRVVALEAKLGLPETELGVFPPYAALRLPELAGPAAAARLMLGGEPIDGSRAHDLGLADVVAPRGDLEMALATVIAPLQRKSASTLRLAKQALRIGSGERDVRLAAIESLYLERLMSSHDANQGLQSFLDKCAPKWLHR